MKQLFLLLMLLMPLSVGAETYSWTDATGTMHFTDDLGSVPAKFRKKALLKESGEDQLSNTPAPPAATVKTKAATVPVAKPASTAVAPDESKVTVATRFGERSAGEWQTEFRSLRGQIKAIEQQIEALKREGGDGKTMLTSTKVAELNSRNKQLNQEYEAVRLRFNQLVEQANKVGLPPEFSK